MDELEKQPIYHIYGKNKLSELQAENAPGYYKDYLKVAYNPRINNFNNLPSKDSVLRIKIYADDYQHTSFLSNSQDWDYFMNNHLKEEVNVIIQNFKNVQELTISGQYTIYPEKIAELTNLQKLSFISNIAATIKVPESYSKLVNLTHLELSGFYIFIPKEIQELPKLEILGLHYFKFIPEAFLKFKHLKKVYLYQHSPNKFDEYPFCYLLYAHPNSIDVIMKFPGFGNIEVMAYEYYPASREVYEGDPPLYGKRKLKHKKLLALFDDCEGNKEIKYDYKYKDSVMAKLSCNSNIRFKGDMQLYSSTGSLIEQRYYNNDGTPKGKWEYKEWAGNMIMYQASLLFNSPDNVEVTYTPNSNVTYKFKNGLLTAEY